jgi:hypothetical protein
MDSDGNVYTGGYETWMKFTYDKDTQSIVLFQSHGLELAHQNEW